MHEDDGGEDHDGLDGARGSVQLEAGVQETRAEARESELGGGGGERREPLVQDVVLARRRLVDLDDRRRDERLVVPRIGEPPSHDGGRAERRPRRRRRRRSEPRPRTRQLGATVAPRRAEICPRPATSAAVVDPAVHVMAPPVMISA